MPRPLSSSAICGVASLILAGCAGAPPPPSEAMRAEIRSIAVTGPTVGALTHESRLPPDPGSSALQGGARGALAGAGEGVRIAARSGGAGGLVGLALIPAGAVVGLIVGAVSAAPHDELEFVRAERDRLPAASEVHGALLANVAAAGRRLQRRPVLSLVGDEADAQGKPPDYRLLSKRGVDSVVEIRLKSFGLAAGDGRNPPMASYMIVEVRMIRAADGTERYARQFRRVGSIRRLGQWRALGTGAVRRDFEAMSAGLAESIVEELFLIWRS